MCAPLGHFYFPLQEERKRDWEKYERNGFSNQNTDSSSLLYYYMIGIHWICSCWSNRRNNQVQQYLTSKVTPLKTKRIFVVKRIAQNKWSCQNFVCLQKVRKCRSQININFCTWQIYVGSELLGDIEEFTCFMVLGIEIFVSKRYWVLPSSGKFFPFF